MDLRSDKVGAMQKEGSGNELFDKSKSVKFVNNAVDEGFKYILTTCPHITKSVNLYEDESINTLYINQIDPHHHHLHIDFWEDGSIVGNEHINRSYCHKCELKDSCDSEHKQ